MRRAGFGVKKGLHPRGLLEEGGKGEGVAPICQLWTCGGGWSGCGGIVEEGMGGSIQCMQFHFSYISPVGGKSPPTNQQTHPHQDTKNGIIFPELISLLWLQGTVYLVNNCTIFIFVFSACCKY